MSSARPERVCPFRGCGQAIPARLFACRRHWFRLNADQQRRIWACYEAWRDGQIDGDELRRRQREVLDEVDPAGRRQRDEVDQAGLPPKESQHG